VNQKFRLIIGFVVVFAGLQQLQAQGINDTITFKAHVYFFFSGKPVDNALIRTSVDSTLTNAKGFFSIRVSKRDTVFVWHPGYREIKAPIRTFGSIENFYLKEDDNTLLDEVLVRKQKEFYLMKFVPKDTIKLYVVREDNTIKTGKDRSYTNNVPMGTGLISELAAQFNKKEQERRKMLDILAEEYYTATYWKVISDPQLQNEFMNSYGISEEEFIDYKLFFHQANQYLHKSTDAKQIRQTFFKQYISYIRYHKFN
jgi:hypothetical protein